MAVIRVELHCHTRLWNWQPFSWRRLEGFCRRARQLGLDWLGITEHADTPGFWDIFAFLEDNRWRWQGLRLLAGCEITVAKEADLLLLGSPEALLDLKSYLRPWPARHNRPLPFGQGFFLARPSYPPPEVNKEAARLLAQNTGADNVRQRSRLGRMIPVGSISKAVTTITTRTITREVVDFFTRYPQVEGVAVLDDDKQPVGLVMRDKLFNQLGTQFGFAVYTERPISLVMDTQPLMVENGPLPVHSFCQAYCPTPATLIVQLPC